MKPIPIYGFGSLTDDELSTKAGHIIFKMTGNSNFSDALAKLTAVKDAKADFDDALVAAPNGGTQATNDKKKKRKILQKALKDLALYVQLNCNDDVTILLSSGYDAKSDGEPRPAPGAPENFTVEAGKNSGSVIASVDPDEYAVIYVYEYALVVEGQDPIWKTVLGKNKVTIKDLIPGKQYMFRSAIKGNSEDLVYSYIITRYVS